MHDRNQAKAKVQAKRILLLAVQLEFLTLASTFTRFHGGVHGNVR